MKKIILSVATLSAALAQAQVGINQETPKATLDISVKKANETTNSQEGLLIPRVTKEKALLMANNTTTQPEESALIYVNDTNLTSPSNATVEDITENGYYFWNGQKWVKSSGSNGELWAQRENNGITETYLKPADTNNDFVGYSSNRKYQLNLGQVTEADGIINPFQGRSNLSFYNKKIPYSIAISSDVLPTDVSTFSSFSNVIRENNAASYAGNFVYYTGQNIVLSTKDLTTPIDGGMTSLSVHTNHFSEAPIKRIIGALSQVHIGDETHNAVVEEHATGISGSVFSNAGSTIETASAISGSVNNYGTIRNLKGVWSSIASQNSHRGSSNPYPPHTIKSMLGIENRVAVARNATVEESITGSQNDITISENVTMAIDKLIYGNHNRIKLSSNFSGNSFFASRNSFELSSDNAVAKHLYLNQSSISSPATGTSIEGNVFGFDFRNHNKDRWTADQIFGIYLSSITNGSRSNYGLYIEDIESNTAPNNYAIYTKKGNIRFGQLEGVGERLVTASQDGVLSTSNKSLADLESLWANDDTAGLVKLKATSNGTPRVNTPAGSRNDVTIDDSGKITAKAFIGYNGATIFPDYVFEKYYTGESTIKADYNFHNLASVESFIKTNGHLPGYKSAKEIASKGLIDLGATQLTNVEKIEELYLHLIEKDKQVQDLKAELEAQKARLNKLESLLNKK